MSDTAWIASLKVGDVVATKRYRTRYVARSVEKVTPKQVKLSGDVTFRISDGMEIGAGSDIWAGRHELFQMTEDVRASIALDNALAKAKRLLSDGEIDKMSLQKLRDLIAIAEQP